MKSSHSTRSAGVATAFALLLLATRGAEGQGSPQLPLGPSSPGTRPGQQVELKTDLVPVLDEASLVRNIAAKPVRVSADGRQEVKQTLPMSFCQGLQAGASRQVALPDIRFGARNTGVDDVRKPFSVVIIYPGHSDVTAGFFDAPPIDRLSRGETRFLTFPRPQPRNIQVTLFQVPARARPTPVPTPGPNGGTSMVMGSRSLDPNDLAHVVCVSNVFVRDPEIKVNVDTGRVVNETNEQNNLRAF